MEVVAEAGGCAGCGPWRRGHHRRTGRQFTVGSGDGDRVRVSGCWWGLTATSDRGGREGGCDIPPVSKDG
jgi:hypothetical protein